MDAWGREFQKFKVPNKRPFVSRDRQMDARGETLNVSGPFQWGDIILLLLIVIFQDSAEEAGAGCFTFDCLCSYSYVTI